MANDSIRGVMVLYGGWGAQGYRETWEYDGSSWTEKNPAHQAHPL